MIIIIASKEDNFATTFKGLAIAQKLSILDVYRGPGFTPLILIVFQMK